MRKQFIGYYPPTSDDLKELYKECLFAFDTNTLLDLYRYSPETGQQWLAILQHPQLQDRIWLPHQAGEEFCRNRADVIERQRNAYTQAERQLTQLLENFRSRNEHPFVNKVLFRELETVALKISAELEKSKQEIRFVAQDDQLLRAIFTIFDGKVGQPYPQDRLNEIYNEGKERYEKRIPPGFEDRDKKPNDAQKYGDLVLWHQLIEKGKERAIVFVTSERKKDWWLLYKSDKKRPISPRPELMAEMSDKGGKGFWLHWLPDFMECMGKELNQSVSEEAIQEVKAVGEAWREGEWNFGNMSWLSEASFTVPPPAHPAGPPDALYSGLRPEITWFQAFKDSVERFSWEWGKSTNQTKPDLASAREILRRSSKEIGRIMLILRTSVSDTLAQEILQTAGWMNILASSDLTPDSMEEQFVRKGGELEQKLQQAVQEMRASISAKLPSSSWQLE